MNGTGVELSWELGKEHPAIDRFRILRGETNDTLTAIDTTDAEARGYIDEGALFSGEARWYKVQALNHGGHVVTESPPTHISLVPPGG